MKGLNEVNEVVQGFRVQGLQDVKEVFEVLTDVQRG